MRLVAVPQGAVSAEDAGAAEVDAGVRPSRGVLRLDTVPWTKVSLRNKSLGETPVLGLALAPGQYVLRPVNAEEGLAKTIEVDIVAGEPACAASSLRCGGWATP